MSKPDDGRFEHPSKAEILTPDTVIADSEKITSHAGDKPEPIPWKSWSEPDKGKK